MCADTFPDRPEWPCDREGTHTLHHHGNVQWGTGSEVPDRHDDTSGGEH